VEGRLVLKDCSLFRADGRVRSGMSVVIEGRTIAAVGADADHPILPGDWEVRCAGRLVAPGLVDCSTRLVTGQLSHWSGDMLLRPFEQRLEVERKIGARVTAADVEVLTAFGLACGLRLGVTMFVENLHAPNCIEAGLEAQARAAHRLGARLVNAHASTSLDAVSGPAQVDANARYAQGQRSDGLVRGAIGIRASCVAEEDLLRQAGRVKEELGVGAQFGLAETDDDLAITWAHHNARIVTRFERFGLLGGACVAGHARAIDRAEAARLAKTRTLIALSPRVAQTIEGGSAMGMESVLVSQNLVGLATCGSGTLWEELAASFSGVMALSRAGRMLDPDHMMSQFLVSGPAELCTMIFGKPSGSVDQGSLADLVVFDYIPAREQANFTAHLLMQLSKSPVAWTIVNGSVTVREGQLIGADFVELARSAAATIERLQDDA
jgi:cytosine/adenosine deaminase-related metal-dependent hydrolase